MKLGHSIPAQRICPFHDARMYCEIYTDEKSNEQWDTGHGVITTRDSARLRYDADPESSVV